MADKAPRTHLVHARLTDAEYAAFRRYVESNPDLENNESVALRRIIREQTAPAARPARPKAATKEQMK